MRNPQAELLKKLLKPRWYNRKNLVLPYTVASSNSPASKILLDKGYEFEQFVVSRFDREWFHLIEWRSDKAIDGRVAFMNRFPDLEFYFKTSIEQMQFAVECKWRDHLNNDCIELKEYQLENYRAFQKATGMPTFIILGIGNTPSYSNEVYIIPLQEITQAILHDHSINIYKREFARSNFYLTCRTKMLK